jgi:hypothetical protein
LPGGNLQLLLPIVAKLDRLEARETVLLPWQAGDRSKIPPVDGEPIGTPVSGYGELLGAPAEMLIAR